MEKYVIIDSRDRIDKYNPSCDSTFELKYGGFYNVKSIELISFSLPLTMYNINSSNNMIYYHVQGQPYDEIIAIQSQVAFIREGNYNAQQLADALNETMNRSGQPEITVVYDEIRMKYVFSCSTPFSFRFGTNTISSAASILGLENVDTDYETNNEAENVADLSYPSYIIISIIGLSTKIKSTNCHDYGTFFCTNNGNGSDVFTWTTNSFYHQETECTSDNIKDLRIQIKTHNNQLLDLNGADWSMFIKINY